MSRSFVALYGGKCVCCGDLIEVGDILRWSDDGPAVHDECAARERREPRPDEADQ